MIKHLLVCISCTQYIFLYLTQLVHFMGVCVNKSDKGVLYLPCVI